MVNMFRLKAQKPEYYVLPADPEPKLLNFTIYEYIGAEVAFADGDGEPITRREDLQIGSQLLVPGLGGWCFMTVTHVDGNRAQANNGVTGAALTFGEDSRQCWVSVCMYNLEALARVEVV